MKNTLKLIVALVLVASMALVAVGCIVPQTEVAAQGVDTENHVIKIGNTAATSGAFQSVGEPFNYAQAAYLWYFSTQTDGYKDADGNKYTFEFIHYDDTFDGAKGKTFTQKLVEEDKVFALVGHFGSNTVGATVDYIQENGIPMVYGVCGVSDLYNTDRNIMTVQPIYDTEGQSMVATAFAPESAGGLGATKLGVISTTDEAGRGMLNGIKIEVERLGKTGVVYVEAAANATDFTAEVTTLKNAGCDVVIIAANQAPFSNIAKAFVTADYDNVDLLTSYVSANYGTMGALLANGVITATREIYAGAWLVTGSAPTDTKGWKDFVEYVRIITLYDKAHNIPLIPADDATNGAYIKAWFGDAEWAKEGVSANYLNSYAMAGYVSANVFCEGLARMSGKTLTWEAFIDAMESAPVDVPMGLSVSYANGQRIGIDSLAVNKYTVANLAVGEVYRGITDLATLEAAIK